MPSLAIAFPLPSGKTDAWRRYIEELKGPRRAEWEHLLGRAGLERHNFYLQRTPLGDTIILYFEGDIARSFAFFATDEDAFTQWVRRQVLETEGVDLTQPFPGPLPEVVLESVAVAAEARMPA
jgi:hypothetical protein